MLATTLNHTTWKPFPSSEDSELTTRPHGGLGKAVHSSCWGHRAPTWTKSEGGCGGLHGPRLMQSL